MLKISTKNIFLIVLVLFVIAGGFFYYFYYNDNGGQQVNYLIPGVPYYGFYNHFFDADSAAFTSTADILGYWGDGVNPPDLLDKFIKGDSNTSDRAKRASQIQDINLNSSQIRSFFQERGYETYRYATAQAGNEINEIKKFVNPKKKIPVIIYQKRSIDSARAAYGFRVVIGVFDKDKKVIVHDHDLGNNYEISYQDFEKMFQPNARVILAVWPSEKLAAKLERPDYTKPYPNRLKAMNNVGELLIKAGDALWLNRSQKYEEAIELYREFITDPKIEYFPPAYRVAFYVFLAQLYVQVDKTDEAIKVLNEKALPINHDLTQSYDDWEKPTDKDRFAKPYYVLGDIYQKKGNKSLAKENFEEVLKIYPNDKIALEALSK